MHFQERIKLSITYIAAVRHTHNMNFFAKVLIFSLLLNIAVGKIRRPTAEIPADSPRIMKGLLMCDCSPTSKTPETVSIGLVKAILTEGSANATLVRAKFDACIQKSKHDGHQSCVNADESFRNKGFNHSVCTYDKNTGQNVSPTKTGTYRILAKCRLQATASVTNDKGSGPVKVSEGSGGNSGAFAVAKKTVSKSKNEGCVAVEHLKGYALQHQYDLIRPVLCFEGFCATPNHALIIHGKYTSMKRMCDKDGEWSGRCDADERRVNNLRLVYGRRAKYNTNIIITPYDIRFPKAAVWIVQISQEILWVIFNIRLPRFFTWIMQMYMLLLPLSLMVPWLRTTLHKE